VLQQGVRSITDLMVMPGLINLDFADVRSVMAEMGKAMMGTGEGSGENRALEAAEKAIANPLLDGVSMQGAKGVIISIIGGDDMKLLEVDEAANHIRELVDPNANIIWGSAFNPDLQGKIRVSVVATGIEQTDEMAIEASRPLNLSASRGPARPALSVPASEPLFERQPEPQAYQPPAPEPEPFELTEAEPLDLAGADEWSDEGEPETAEEADGAIAGAAALDLAEEYLPEQEAGQNAGTGNDELLLDASRLTESDDSFASPLVTRKRPLVSGDSLGGGGGAAAPGNTLFERMANLSRGRATPAEEEEEGDADASSISIPRFLGRQNNQ
jgi:cell division protein FtsZ